jgi:hypothetical protein
MNLGPLEILLLIGLCGVASALIFRTKGRSVLAGLVFGLILGPIGVAVALVLTSQPSQRPTS